MQQHLAFLAVICVTLRALFTDSGYLNQYTTAITLVLERIIIKLVHKWLCVFGIIVIIIT